MIQQLLFEYSSDIDDIYMEEYNKKNWKILIVFADGIAFMLSNKKFNPLVTQSFFRGKKIRKILLY